MSDGDKVMLWIFITIFMSWFWLPIVWVLVAALYCAITRKPWPKWADWDCE